ERRPHHREIPRIGLPRGMTVDLVHVDHVPPEHHRLQVEPARVGQYARDLREQTPIDLLLTARAVIVWRTEMLEGTEARDRVERAEALAGHFTRVIEVHVEAVATTGGLLRGGQRHADSDRADAPDVVEQPS